MVLPFIGVVWDFPEEAALVGTAATALMGFKGVSWCTLVEDDA